MVAVAEEKAGPDPDQAWKVLTLVNDWIKHADSKVGATVAVTAATAVGLYKVLDSVEKPGWVVMTMSFACAVFLLLAAGQALMALTPRVHLHKKRPERYDNLLFYRHIARGYRTTQRSQYLLSLAELTVDRHELTRQIAAQVYANAAVADRKYGWSNKAIVSLAVAITFLALAAFAAWK